MKMNYYLSQQDCFTVTAAVFAFVKRLLCVGTLLAFSNIAITFIKSFFVRWMLSTALFFILHWLFLRVRVSRIAQYPRLMPPVILTSQQNCAALLVESHGNVLNLFRAVFTLIGAHGLADGMYCWW